MRFSQVDVFTDRLLAGNPVAVVHDADAVPEQTMAALAWWTNLSETTFLLPTCSAGADYRLRIFTPERELPFAGHPTLGSARAWLDAGGAPTGDVIVQECAAGLIPIRRRGARLSFRAPPLVREGPVDEHDLVRWRAALRLTPDDVRDARWVDNGPGWAALMLVDADAVLALEATDVGAAGKIAVIGPYPPGADAAFEVRAFVPGRPGGEDPVTGSLNAGLAQWLRSTGRAAESYVVSQGTRVQRRGRVYVEQVDREVWVGGDTVVGIQGHIDLPVR